MRISTSSIVGTFALVQLSIACSESPGEIETGVDRAAITSGAFDFSYPSVVAVMIDTAAVCTATMIAPDRALTAAHCAQADLGMAWIAVGSDTNRPMDAAPVVAVTKHPRFDGIHSDADVAILELSRPLDGLPIMAIADEPPAEGASLLLVGYGRSEVLQPAGARQRLAGTIRVDDVQVGTLVTAPDPSQSCNGDSGGPAIMITEDGTPAIAGVVSQADQSCAGWGRLARTDVLRAGFLDAFTTTSPLPFGARCFDDRQCASGLCVQAADEPLVRTCCEGDAASPSCNVDAPSPGAAGASCETRFDCAIGLCTINDHGATACGQPCADDSDCAPGSACLPSTDGPLACTGDLAHDHDGGCRSTGGTGGAGAIVLALAVIALHLGTRNRTARR